MTQPEHIIPFHGEPDKSKALKEISLEEGYKPKEIHLLEDGDSLIFD